MTAGSLLRFGLPLGAMLLLLSACAARSAWICPEASRRPPEEALAACAAPYPRTPVRLIHSIEGRLPGGARMVLLGVTLVDPARSRLRSALLSAEGLVLFEASSGPAGTVVHRALPPLDAPGFGRGMMGDVSRLFLFPAGSASIDLCQGEDGRICRFVTPEGTLISRLAQGEWLLMEEGGGGRTVTGSGLDENGLWTQLTLHVPGPAGYELILTRLESEPLSDGEGF